MQIQISWLLKKPTDLDLHCLQRQGISRFSRTMVKICPAFANSTDTDQLAKKPTDLDMHCLLLSM